MKIDKNFSMLHFSDLHFGEFSMQSDEVRSGDFKNYFTRLLNKVSYILRNEKVDIVIISGDFCSKNLFFFNGNGEKKSERRRPLVLPDYLKDFLNLFKNADIPIVICIGNHEINRNVEKHEERTQIYKEFKKLIEDYMNSEFSENFDQNLINYKLYEDRGILVFSIDTTINLRDENGDDPNIDLKVMIDFFKELDSKGLNCSGFKKILVCHHPIKTIHDYEDVEPYLIESNVEFILSGHYHKKYVDMIYRIGTTKLIINLIAGSPFLNLEKRTEGQIWNPVNFQFNSYVLSGSHLKQISGDYYIYNENKVWEKRDLILPFNISHGFQTWLERIKEQTKNHPSEERIKVLKENGNQTEEEEMRYISWIFYDFIKNFSFELKEIMLICKYFGAQVQKFFNEEENFDIIEKVLINAGIDNREENVIFLENLKQGKKIWIGTIQEFHQYLIKIFNLNEKIVEKIYVELFCEMKIGSSVKSMTLASVENLENINYIEDDDKIKSTLEIINEIYYTKIRDFKLRKKIYSEFGIDITDLDNTLLDFAAKSLASSILDYDGVFLSIWRDRLHNIVKKYVHNKLKEKNLGRSISNLNEYVEMISDYTLILAKDNIELVI